MPTKNPEPAVTLENRTLPDILPGIDKKGARIAL